MYDVMQLQGTPWQPGQDENEAYDHVREVVFWAGIRLGAFLVDQSLLTVGGGEDVGVADQEGDDWRNYDQCSGGDDVSPLEIPVDDTDKGLLIVAGTRVREKRRTAKAQCCHPY